MATANQIREVVRAQPFRPFIIHLADGRTFDVPHPEFRRRPQAAASSFSSPT